MAVHSPTVAAKRLTKQEIEAQRIAMEQHARQARRDQLAVAQCEYRAQATGDRAEAASRGLIWGIVNNIATTNYTRTQCLEFYQRNGALPGDPLD